MGTDYFLDNFNFILKLKSFIYFFLIVLVLMLILIIVIIVSLKLNNLDKEKLISFECGFNSFFLPRRLFSIQFFKIILVFLFFDIEIIIILSLLFFTIKVYFSLYLIFFIMIFLLLGLFLEIKEGRLEWLN